MALRNRWNISVKCNFWTRVYKRKFTSSKHQMSSIIDQQVKFPGCDAPFTTKLSFTTVDTNAKIPIYRVMRNNGEIIDSVEDPQLPKDLLTKMYKNMIIIKHFDKYIGDAQRKGKITYYIENTGEEGIQMGSGAAISQDDLIFCQYREIGVQLMKGVSIETMANQNYGNCDDKMKGRQLCFHYGDRENNIVAISSPLATQIPQAAGAAYSFKRDKGNKKCIICFFGEGAASEGDFQAGINFAATLEGPIVFICRNNGYAVSTCTEQQYRGDGIGARGPAYGINTIRVDGTDVLASYNAIKMARDYALSQNKPVLVESMTYRISSHSTSDDDSYREKTADVWITTENPIQKFRLYLELNGMWNQKMEDSWDVESDKFISDIVKTAASKPKPNWREIFTDVYHTMPLHLKKQMDELETHLKKYGKNYRLHRYKK